MKSCEFTAAFHLGNLLCLTSPNISISSEPKEDLKTLRSQKSQSLARKAYFSNKKPSSKAIHWMQVSRNSWMWQVQGPQSKKLSQESPREDKTDRENICCVSAMHLHLLSERSLGREVIKLYRLIDEKLSKFTPWHN